jgi:hypothetical protein
MPGGTERGTRIARAIREVAAGAKPEAAAKHLLDALVSDSESREPSASIYLLDLCEARFELFAHHGRRPEASSISLEAAGVSHTDLTPADTARDARGPLGEHRLPIVRDDTMIGLLNIDASEVGLGELFEDAPFDVLSAVFVWLYEQRFASRLLGELQKPIPYDRDERWFLADLLNVIRQSSGMAYTAIRERAANDSLRCLAVRGFGEDTAGGSLSEMLSFEGIADNYPAFAEAMESGEVKAELDIQSPRNRFLRTHAALKDVRSYVVAPIKVGSETLGTLSLATKVRYPFTRFELQGFESIANGVGIAIVNFRNHHNMLERFGDIAVGVSAIEIASSMRHAVGAKLERSWHWLEKVKGEMGKSNPQPQMAIGELETDLKLLSEDLKKFKVATERPTDELKQVLLKERWEYAEDALDGRMTNLGIDAQYVGPEMEIVGYPDWIGHLFLNLMLNSMDAFEQTKRKGGREIRLRVERADGAGDISALYSDTATGIVGTKLVGGPAWVSELPVKQRIFEAHVTSKRSPEAGYQPEPGSGLGLFLVRRIMDIHGGSIDLLDSREGVRFRLVFPQQLIEKNQ